MSAGKTGSASVRKMSKVSWQGGSRPESESLHFEPGVTLARRTKGLCPLPCNRRHSMASTGLCPFGGPCCLCLLQPLTPRVLELPPWFPRLPFSHTGELSCPYLSAVAFNVCSFGFFVFNQSSFSPAFSLQRGFIPTQQNQHLSVCSLFAEQPTETFVFHLL